MAGANRSQWVHQAHFNVTLLKGLFWGSILSLQWHNNNLHTCAFSCGRGFQMAASLGIISYNLRRAIAFGKAILDFYDAHNRRTAMRRVFS